MADSVTKDWDQNDFFEEEEDEEEEEPGCPPPCRVILLLDLDSFEVQVWMNKKRRDLIGLDVPIVVLNLDETILATNYTAKNLGINRSTLPSGPNGLKKAREICKTQNIQLHTIFTDRRHGKGDSFYPIQESDKILSVIESYREKFGLKTTTILERKNTDEFYLDLTQEVNIRSSNLTKNGMRMTATIPPKLKIDQLTMARKLKSPQENHFNKSVVILEGRTCKIDGRTLSHKILEIYPQSLAHYHWDEVRLIHGAVICQEIVDEIFKKTGYISSGGVGPNKLLAKVACPLNKPEGITILPTIGYLRLAQSRLQITDLPGFMRKRGREFRELLEGQQQQGRMKNFSLKQLTGIPIETIFQWAEKLKWPDSLATDLINKCHGLDESMVTNQLHKESMGTELSFGGYYTPRTREAWEERISYICTDMAERLQYQRDIFGRQPKELTLTVESRAQKPCQLGTVGVMAIGDGRMTRNEDIQNFVLNHFSRQNIKFDANMRPPGSPVGRIKLKATGFNLITDLHLLDLQNLSVGHQAHRVVHHGAAKNFETVKEKPTAINESPGGFEILINLQRDQLPILCRVATGSAASIISAEAVKVWGLTQGVQRLDPATTENVSIFFALGTGFYDTIRPDKIIHLQFNCEDQWFSWPFHVLGAPTAPTAPLIIGSDFLGHFAAILSPQGISFGRDSRGESSAGEQSMQNGGQKRRHKGGRRGRRRT